MITKEIVKEHGLTQTEYQMIVNLMKRTPNLVELGIFSVMWSEHCSYKSSRKYLSKLPVTGQHVIQGPGENAGVVDIGNGLAAIFKMESHNHPSFIEPFQGATTGVGGIMRDVFTMGARPIANLNALRFGEISHPKTRHLLSGVVSGIGHYGNCMGVPTIGGEVNFDPSYNGNILVNAMCVGLAETNKVFYAAATEIGASVVYVGSKTGRDGIHGATMASAEFDDNSEEKRPTVQVGDPFTQKRLLEACLELMQSDAIIAIQDMGAAGLTSSSVEMADKGGVGIELNLDHVPCREDNMTAYEMLLSESQERMLMVLKPGREQEAKDIFTRWELDCAVIGRLIDTKHIEIFHHNKLVANIPLAGLADGAPIYDRPYVKTPQRKSITITEAPQKGSLSEILTKMIALPDLISRRWIWEQYDHMVMGDTVLRPGISDSGVVRIHGTNKALAMSCDVTPRYCYADPFEGGKQAVVETWRNLISVGAKGLAITNCLNFGNPERPEIMGQFVGCLEGISEACLALEYPVVSGNVSLYNETNGQGILPTPAIGGVGLIQEIDKIPKHGFTTENEVIYLIGETKGHLGCSLYLRDILNKKTEELGTAPTVNLEQEKHHGQFIYDTIQKRLPNAVHDISNGGLLVALAQMCLRGVYGCTLSIKLTQPPHAFCFSEDQARYLVTLNKTKTEDFETMANTKNIPYQKIGITGGDKLIFNGETLISLTNLRNIHENTLPHYMSTEKKQ